MTKLNIFQRENMKLLGQFGWIIENIEVALGGIKGQGEETENVGLIPCL